MMANCTTRPWLAAVLLLFSVLALSAADDPIRAAYERSHWGDVRGAYEDFGALYRRQPDNLAAGFGAYSTLYGRLMREEGKEAEFAKELDELIERAEFRYSRQQDPEALFYLAQAHTLRGLYRFEHDKGLFGAARDAAKAKRYSEDYIRQHPERADAYLALGIYNYYVDIAPSFVKFLRALLFLPSGSRQEGLKQLEKAAAEGELFAPRARFQLTQIYGWLEGRAPEAVRMAEELAHKYPENPEVLMRLANLYAAPGMEDYERSATAWAAVVARAEKGQPNFTSSIRYDALLGLARARQQEWRLEEAVATLTPTIEAGVNKPSDVRHRFLLARGNYRALLNDTAAAEDARRVLTESKGKNELSKSAEEQLRWIQERIRSGEAARYAELIPGNRLVVERKWEEAERFYLEFEQRHPGDWQGVYRLAWLDFTRRRFPEAEAGFNRIVGRNPGKMPDWLKASALLNLGRVDDLRKERERALERYREVIKKFPRQPAASWARIGVVTPYRLPEK